jgi:hypothetical protein
MKSKKRKSRKKLVTKRLTHFIGVFGSSLILIVGIALVLFAVYGFMIQFHNIDLSYNMALMTNDVNQLLIEKNISLEQLDYRMFNDMYDFGKTAPYTHFYLFAANSLPIMLFVAIIGAFLLGYGFVWNISIHSEYEPKKK